MINKRLINSSKESLKNVTLITILLIIAMALNIFLIMSIASYCRDLFSGIEAKILNVMQVYIIVAVLRAIIKKYISKLTVKTSSEVKITLRTEIYNKILKLNGNYTNKIKTAEVLQIASEGIDQLEMYFANYLPQFFYCMIAPLILFLFVGQISFKSAIVLFICVPLIPMSIMIVQKIAKKLLAKYWGLYTSLGDDFLENVQGMTTLKIYGADEKFHNEMNKSAENFRKITMKVLSMQLNSIIIMDIIAYGGASLGAIMAINELSYGNIDIFGAIVIILISSEFFLPMRMLGSFFHIAMNGMSASKKMFRILDISENEHKDLEIDKGNSEIEFKNISFSYDNENKILDNISFDIKKGLTSIVGVSGSGKSTISSLIILKNSGYDGEILINNTKLMDISKKSIHKNITRVTDKGYIFEGTVSSNLKMAKENVTAQEMIDVLKRANIWDLFESRQGLETEILERGSNLSGGEKQRLNIARALLKDSLIYIFDEVTSNIDVESEDDIMKVILELAKEKTVLLISHRLQNVISSQKILMLKDGKIIEEGTHKKLLEDDKTYANLFNTQRKLEEVRL